MATITNSLRYILFISIIVGFLAGLFGLYRISYQAGNNKCRESEIEFISKAVKEEQKIINTVRSMSMQKQRELLRKWIIDNEII